MSKKKKIVRKYGSMHLCACPCLRRFTLLPRSLNTSVRLLLNEWITFCIVHSAHAYDHAYTYWWISNFFLTYVTLSWAAYKNAPTGFSWNIVECYLVSHQEFQNKMCVRDPSLLLFIVESISRYFTLRVRKELNQKKK